MGGGERSTEEERWEGYAYGQAEEEREARHALGGQLGPGHTRSNLLFGVAFCRYGLVQIVTSKTVVLGLPYVAASAKLHVQ